MKKPLLLVCSFATIAACATLARAGEPSGELRQDYNITVEGFVPAQSLRQSLPYYDDTLKRIGIEGTVVVHGRIDEKGRVRDVEPVSGHPVLARAARQAVERWRYKPAQVASKPVAVGLSVTVDFRLRAENPSPSAVASRPAGVTVAARTSADGYF